MVTGHVYAKRSLGNHLRWVDLNLLVGELDLARYHHLGPDHVNGNGIALSHAVGRLRLDSQRGGECIPSSRLRRRVDAKNARLTHFEDGRLRYFHGARERADCPEGQDIDP